MRILPIALIVLSVVAYANEHHEHHDEHSHHDHEDHDDEYGEDCGCCDHHHDEDMSFLKSFQHEVLEATPWVVLGVGVTALLSAFELPEARIALYLRRGGHLKAALMGLLVPLCSCGALPVAMTFSQRGVALGIIVAFLTASQSAGLDSAAITVGLLGWSAALCRLVGAVVLAVCAGMAVPRSNQAVMANNDQGSSKTSAVAEQANGPRPNIVLRFVSASAATSAEIFPLVCFGLGISTAARTWLPSLTSYDEAFDDVAQSWIRGFFYQTSSSCIRCPSPAL